MRTRLRSLFRNMLRRGRVEKSLSEELQACLDILIQQRIAQGVGPEEARRQALAELGGVEPIKEQVRSTRAGAFLGPMLQDLRFAWRRLRHAPGFTLVAVLTLAVAVGANTAVLSVADGVLFRPLPFHEPDRLFLLQMFNRASGGRSSLVRYDYVDAIDRQGATLSGVAQFDSGPRVSLQTIEGVEPIPTLATSPNYFDVLGIRPVRGRLFVTGDTPGRTAVLTYQSWRSRFGNEEAMIGNSIRLGEATFDIVGVLPADFLFPTSRGFSGRPEVITVMEPVPTGTPGGTFHPIVRLEPGVTRERAQAEIESLVAPINAAVPTERDRTPFLEDIRATIYPVGQPIMRLLLAASALVLLIGCANLANMLLTRAQRRERESAVRAALGASRVRMVRPLLFEALIIGLAGSVVALIVTNLAFDWLLRQVPTAALGNAPVGIDRRVAAIGLACGLVGSVVFALVPAWRSSRRDVQTLIFGRHRGGRPPHRLGRPMVAAQVALAIVLVFGAAVATRAFVSVLRTPLGFDSENVMTVSVFPPRGTKSLPEFYRGVLETLARRPDVIAAGATGSVPLGGAAPWSHITRPGAKDVIAGVVHALPGYHSAAGIGLVRGRLLTWDDGAAAPGTVLSESAARVLFPNVDPIGGVLDSGKDESWRVVGIVRDVRSSLGRESPPPVYVIPTGRTSVMEVLVRMRERRAASLIDVRRALVQSFPASPISTGWWSNSIQGLTAFKNPRFQTLVLTSFAAMALGLTALGVFGVVAFLVASRTREMGIRVAVGASPGSLVGLVVLQTLWPVVVGLLVGLLATRWAAQFAQAQLFNVETDDPMTLALAGGVVLLAALVAAYLPARRASRVDPLIVLRAE